MSGEHTAEVCIHFRSVVAGVKWSLHNSFINILSYVFFLLLTLRHLSNPSICSLHWENIHWYFMGKRPLIKYNFTHILSRMFPLWIFSVKTVSPMPLFQHSNAAQKSRHSFISPLKEKNSSFHPYIFSSALFPCACLSNGVYVFRFQSLVSRVHLNHP